MCKHKRQWYDGRVDKIKIVKIKKVYHNYISALLLFEAVRNCQSRGFVVGC